MYNHVCAKQWLLTYDKDGLLFAKYEIKYYCYKFINYYYYKWPSQSVSFVEWFVLSIATIQDISYFHWELSHLWYNITVMCVGDPVWWERGRSWAPETTHRLWRVQEHNWRHTVAVVDTRHIWPGIAVTIPRIDNYSHSRPKYADR